MKKYFLYLLKKNLLPLLCLTLFCIVLYVVPVSVQDYSRWNLYGSSHYYYNSPALYYGNISAALGLLSVFVPIYLFSYKMNRRSVDMYYSLPLNKTKILITNLLVGLFLLYVPYTFAYLWGFVTVAARVKRLYLIYYLYLYLASLVPALIMYTVTAFIYTRANTIIDGILSVVGALFLLAMVWTAVESMYYDYDWYPSGISFEHFFPFSPLISVTDVFGRAVIDGKVAKWFVYSNKSGLRKETGELINAVLWTLLATAAAVGLILTEKNCKAENCRQISNSIFCFKVQIPVYTALLTAAAWSTTENIPLLCAIAFGAFVVSVIYKRTIKIGWKFAVVLAACFLGGILFSIVSNALIYASGAGVI